MDTIEKLFVLQIIEYEEYDAVINCINENGKKVLLRARGFFKEESKNILKFKELSFLMVEYIKSKNLDYKNWGLLKTGEVLLEFDEDNRSDLEFKYLFQDIILQVHNNFNKNNFELILQIIKAKNSKIIDSKLLILFFLQRTFYDLGYRLVLNKCSICGTNKQIKTFSLNDRGLICKNCFKENVHYIYLVDEVKFIMLFFSINKLNDFLNLSWTLKHEQIVKEILKDFFNNELGFNLK